MNIKCYFLFAVVLLFVACEKKDKNITSPPKQEVRDSSIYVCGYERNEQGKLVAKYWKDGVPVLLTDGKNNAQANSIFVDGKDVYVCGVEDSIASETLTFRNGRCWKNGVSIKFVDNSTSIIPEKIFVEGQDIYVGATETSVIPGAGANTAVKYWKNGVPFVVSGTASFFTSLYVSKSNVYVSGNVASGTQAAYWTNGNHFDLYRNIMYTTALDVFASPSGNVYVCGATANYWENFSRAVYWKDGVVNHLTDGPKSYQATSIAVFNDTVYTCGTEFGFGISLARYWKNNTQINLTDDSVSGTTSSIYVNKGIAYVAGTVGGTAVYWTDGKLTELTDGKRYATATGIFVTY
ncbi:hypothetical protein ACLOAU_09900 [Niabella sp. CJ426]|uniref:hypothetical protein n=1 Tax=Niabella sp. CJ426 TaxID=3393740 RepID=UPI003D02C9C6